jgi:hypothetical protein
LRLIGTLAVIFLAIILFWFIGIPVIKAVIALLLGISGFLAAIVKYAIFIVLSPDHATAPRAAATVVSKPRHNSYITTPPHIDLVATSQRGFTFLRRVVRAISAIPGTQSPQRVGTTSSLGAF